MIRSTLAAAFVALLAWAPAFAFAAEVGRMSISLGDDRWQTLPLGVDSVRVGPDGRLWFTDFRGYVQRKLPELKEHIAAEFAKPSPRLSPAAHLELFEPGGRVWFSNYHPHALIGYDGKTWVTKTIDSFEDSVYRGRPTRGQLFRGRNHRFAGGAVWFRGKRGVYRFDGKEWGYQRMIEGKQVFGKWVYFSVHATGKVAAAHVTQTADLWLFRDGEWAKHEIFSAEDAAVTQIAVETPRSILYVDHQRRLRRLAIGDDGGVELAERESKTAALGEWRPSDVQAMYHDQRGRIYVAANIVKNADGGEGTPGVIIHDPRGATRFLRDDEQFVTAWMPAGGHELPILTPDENAIWLPNPRGGGPAYLYDLGSAKVAARLHDPKYCYLVAVAEKGRLFVKKTSGIERVMVFSPSGRAQPALESTIKKIGHGPVAASGDGTIYTIDDERLPICWTGGKWHRLSDRPHRKFSTSVVPGRGNMALIADGLDVLLCEGPTVIAEGNLTDLVEKRNEWLVNAFAHSRPQPPAPQPLQVAVSRAGLTWCLTGKLRLFADGAWHDPIAALKAAGSKRGNVKLLAPIGGSGRIFVSDLKLRSSGGQSFYGQFTMEGLKFSEAPHVTERRGSYLLGRDQSLWLATRGRFSTGSSDWITGQNAIRVPARGPAQVFNNAGDPCLVDEAGNVWLRQIRGKSVEHVHVWSDGKIVQQLQIPNYEGGFLCSDRPGSVYAMTLTGLQHLLADGPDFREYRLAEQHAIEDLQGRLAHATFSPLGYIVLATSREYPTWTYALQLIRLPAQGD